jgi:hypothetical protein
VAVLSPETRGYGPGEGKRVAKHKAKEGKGRNYGTKGCKGRQGNLDPLVSFSGNRSEIGKWRGKGKKRGMEREGEGERERVKE